ncbi:unnamed protein product, partial [Prorocentrum cordatum]
PLEDLFAPDFRCVPRLIGHWHRPGQLIDQRTGAGTPASGWLSSVAMELVEGQGFEEHLAGLATEGSVRDVLEAALELLECLGAREVEHGDLWAPNLLVARPPSGGRARLVAIDFGAARLRPRGGLQAEDLLVLDGRARGSPPGVAAAQGVLSQAEQRALLFLRRAGVAAEDFPELIPNFFVGAKWCARRQGFACDAITVAVFDALPRMHTHRGAVGESRGGARRQGNAGRGALAPPAEPRGAARAPEARGAAPTPRGCASEQPVQQHRLPGRLAAGGAAEMVDRRAGAAALGKGCTLGPLLSCERGVKQASSEHLFGGAPRGEGRG